MKKLFTLVFFALAVQGIAQCSDLATNLFAGTVYPTGWHSRQLCWPENACSPAPVVLSIEQTAGHAAPGVNTVVVTGQPVGVVATITSPACDAVWAQRCIGTGAFAELSFYAPADGRFVLHLEAQGTANIGVSAHAGGQAPQPAPQCPAVGIVPRIADKVRYRSFDPLTGRLGHWQDVPDKGLNLNSLGDKVWGL